jgi:CubicO group peptidase (beta-lactamase class C family)
MSNIEAVANPDLTVGNRNKQRWNQPEHRRHGFHNAHRMFRQSLSMRSALVLKLAPTINPSITKHDGVRDLTAMSTFSGLVVARDDAVLFEIYAPDYCQHQPHSIQSITKMHINLIMGSLIQRQLIDPGKPITHYLPDIGSGYAQASVQMLLDMNVCNDFSEDYDDPDCDAYTYEVSLGWRLPVLGQRDLCLTNYLKNITGSASRSQSGEVDYKSANTDVLAWIADVVTGGELLAMMRGIVDAAGYEHTFHISTDKEGFPSLSGGGCLTARDLARLGLLFARRGIGVGGLVAGDAEFMNASMSRDYPTFAAPRQWMGYSNHLFTNGRWIGHGGYGGQFLLIDMETGTTCAFLSVLENEAGYDQTYMLKIIENLQDVACAG